MQQTEAQHSRLHKIPQFSNLISEIQIKSKFQKNNSDISSIIKEWSPLTDDLHSSATGVIMTEFLVCWVFLLHWKIDQYQLQNKVLTSQRTHQSAHIFLPNYVINFNNHWYFLRIWYKLYISLWLFLLKEAVAYVCK